MQSRPMTPDQSLAEAVRRRRAGDRGGARRLCERLLAADGGHLPARHLLALVLLEDGALDAGIGHLELVLAAQPDNASALHGLGKAYGLAGRGEEGLDCLRRAQALAPDNPEVYLELAALEAAADRDRDAEDWLRRGLARFPGHAGLMSNLGTLLVGRGEFKGGLALLREVAQGNKGSADAAFNLALALKTAGRAEEAVQRYREAVRLKPDFAAAWQNLGNLLMRSGDAEGAAAAYEARLNIRRAPGGPSPPLDTFRRTSHGKLKHDIEQFEYLARTGVEPERMGEAAELYRRALARLPDPPAGSHIVELPADVAARLAPTYNRLVHRAEAPVLPGGAINRDLDWTAIAADYHANRPGFTCIDGLLTDEALRSLRRFCLESTIWYTFRYANGYLGAFMDDGFNCPLLRQIGDELRRALPGVIGAHRLRKLWSFKCDHAPGGVPLHADFAAINVNFWITPDAANLDADGGGLVVWDKEAPLEWGFAAYNADEAGARRFLKDAGARPVNVAHRQNRALVFNSDLFHESGAARFRDGYENRRINVTLLYGDRRRAGPAGPDAA